MKSIARPLQPRDATRSGRAWRNTEEAIEALSARMTTRACVVVVVVEVLRDRAATTTSAFSAAAVVPPQVVRLLQLPRGAAVQRQRRPSLAR